MAFTYPDELASLAAPPADLLKSSGDIAMLAVGAFIFRTNSSGILGLLLVRRQPNERTFAGLWEVPGGGVEMTDATVLHACVREVREETGLTVTSVDEFIEAVEFWGTTSGRRIRKYNFGASVKDEEVRTDPIEHDAYKWCTLEESEGLDVTTEEHRISIRDAFRKKMAAAKWARSLYTYTTPGF